MTRDEVIEKLAKVNRAQVARDTGLNYMWLYDVKRGHIKEPGSKKFDILRDYLMKMERKPRRAQ